MMMINIIIACKYSHLSYLPAQRVSRGETTIFAGYTQRLNTLTMIVNDKHLTSKPEEGWFRQPKYCFQIQYNTMYQLCSSLWTSHRLKVTDAFQEY